MTIYNNTFHINVQVECSNLKKAQLHKAVKRAVGEAKRQLYEDIGFLLGELDTTDDYGADYDIKIREKQ